MKITPDVIHGQTRICPVCGKEYLQPIGRKEKKYCSTSCRQTDWKRKRRNGTAESAGDVLICACCGMPFLAYGAKGRKFCSRECYIGYRFHNDINNEDVENAGKSLTASCPGSDAGTNAKREDRDQESIRWKQIDKADISRYVDNPYVLRAGDSEVILSDLFYADAKELLEIGVDRLLAVFEINPLNFSFLEKRQIKMLIERGGSYHSQDEMPAEVTDTALRVMWNRMAETDRLVRTRLLEIGSCSTEIKPRERRDICLMLDSFPKDPWNIYTKSLVIKLAGVSRDCFYGYLRNEKRGLGVDERDAIDEKYVRHAFEYKGYKKGVRMVYMLIPTLSGRKIGIDRVRRIMGKYGMDCGVRKANTSRQAAAERLAKYTKDNLLKRMFRLHRPNEVRITDVTYLEYGEDQKAYGSALMDPVTDMLIAFVVSDSNDLELAKETLRMMDSHPCLDGGLFHSDQGSLYLSPEFQKEVEKLGLRQSMSKRGNCWDNAPMESFFGHFKDECSYEGCKTIDELKQTIEDYAWYYNHERGMWGRKHLTPVKYEEYLLSLSEEAFDEYLETEKKKYEDMKEKAAKKAKKRYKTLGV